MRKKLTILFTAVVFMFSGISASYAAFPEVAPLNKEVVKTTDKLPVPEDTKVTDNKETKTTKTKAKKTAHKRKGKSQILATILCFLVGIIGIHRFYLGYTWQGIVQIITLGGLGIWTLIDLIRILLGTLGPKDGKYEKTF